MTWKEWFIHLRSWVRSFPWKNIEEHLWIAAAGEVEHDCLICGAFAVEEETWKMTRAPRPTRRIRQTRKKGKAKKG